MPVQTDVQSPPARSGSLLEISGFAVARGGRTLLAEIDLALLPGDLVALTGPSGCGKTTLLRAVAGLVDAEAGDVYLRGTPWPAGDWPSYRRQVVLVPQRPVLLVGTVLANLARAFGYASCPSPFAEDAARDVLGRLGLPSGAAEQEARSLSEGQQQRVALARALLVEPSLLLLDEPTSALDGATRRAVEIVVRDHASHRGAAALVVTHDEEQAGRWCDRRVDLARHARGVKAHA